MLNFRCLKWPCPGPGNERHFREYPCLQEVFAMMLRLKQLMFLFMFIQAFVVFAGAGDPDFCEIGSFSDSGVESLDFWYKEDASDSSLHKKDVGIQTDEGITQEIFVPADSTQTEESIDKWSPEKRLSKIIELKIEQRLSAYQGFDSATVAYALLFSMYAFSEELLSVAYNVAVEVAEEVAAEVASGGSFLANFSPSSLLKMKAAEDAAKQAVYDSAGSSALCVARWHAFSACEDCGMYVPANSLPFFVRESVIEAEIREALDEKKQMTDPQKIGTFAYQLAEKKVLERFAENVPSDFLIKTFAAGFVKARSALADSGRNIFRSEASWQNFRQKHFQFLSDGARNYLAPYLHALDRRASGLIESAGQSS